MGCDIKKFNFNLKAETNSHVLTFNVMSFFLYIFNSLRSLLFPLSSCKVSDVWNLDTTGQNIIRNVTTKATLKSSKRSHFSTSSFALAMIQRSTLAFSHFLSHGLHRVKPTFSALCCLCLIKRRCVVHESARALAGWRNSSAGTRFALRDGRGWRRGDMLARETYTAPPTHWAPSGNQGIEILLDFLSLPLSLSFGCGNSSWNI